MELINLSQRSASLRSQNENFQCLQHIAQTFLPPPPTFGKPGAGKHPLLPRHSDVIKMTGGTNEQDS